jgi:riboflavin kinase/FMN adenylyltransferase
MASVTVDWRDALPDSVRDGAVAIGNFDGAHRGHASLIAALRTSAETVRGPAVALTFDPHPLALLRPDLPLSLLTTPADRAALLHDLGADHVVVLRIAPDFLHLTAAEFFAQVVQQRFRARALVEGPNFGFGHNREGDIETLQRLCRAAELGLIVVPPLQLDGEEVSSSRVRAALLRGDIEQTTRLLGRPYRLHGVVGTGQRRGRTIGFPTANLEQLTTVVPGDGVYAVRAQLADGASWPAGANIGPNPTFGEQARKVEAHLIGFAGELHGQPIALDFLGRLRDTRPFESAAELIEQLQRDVEQARRWPASGSPS